MEVDNKIKWLDYLLMYLLVGISSVPFLIGDIYLVFGFLLTAVLMLLRREKFDLKVFFYATGFGLLMLTQALFTQSFDFFILLAFVLRIFYAYFTIKLLSNRFLEVYLRMMAFFAVSSLIIVFLLLAFPPFWDILRYQIAPALYGLNVYKDYYHIFIFTLNVGDQLIPRNPGPFWEPGGFAVFLNVALILNILKNHEIWNRRNLLFILTILTTQSTGGYISLFCVLIGFSLTSKVSLKWLALIPLLVLLSYNAFFYLPFLNEKIEKNIAYSQKRDTKYLAKTRLVGAIEDWGYIKESPLIGRSRFVGKDEEVFNSQSKFYRNNGTTNFIAVFGLIGSLIYFGYVVTGFAKIANDNPWSRAFVAVACLMIIGLSQNIFFKPFFIGLSFLMFTVPVTIYQRNPNA